MKKWRLDPKDVRRTFSQAGASTLTHTRPYNRKNQLRTYGAVLVHQPTGVSVTKMLGPAQHCKKEWNLLIEEAYQQLFPVLEKAVAQHLRISGQ